MLISTTKPPAGSVGLKEVNKDFCAASIGAQGVYPRSHFVPKLIKPLDDTSQWDTGIRVTKAADTTNYICSQASTPQSMKCTKQTGDTSSFTWANWKTHIDNVATKRDAGSLYIVTMADLLGIGV